MDKAKMYPIMQFKDAETEIDTEILKDLLSKAKYAEEGSALGDKGCLGQTTLAVLEFDSSISEDYRKRVIKETLIFLQWYIPDDEVNPNGYIMPFRLIDFKQKLK